MNEKHIFDNILGATDLIDSETPPIARSTLRFHDGSRLELVMSDEFNEPGRSFEKGRDPLFEAINMPDNSNEGLQFCKLSKFLFLPM
jgi:hypothetical protein